MILVTFSGFSGTFFTFPGLYRQANTRPASRPPSDWPDSPRGEKREAGRPGPPPFSFPCSGSSLHTNDLAQRMDDFDQVPLRSHDRLDRLVGRGCFVDDLGVLALFDTFGHSRAVFNSQAALGLGPLHRAACTLAAAHDAYRCA